MNNTDSFELIAADAVDLLLAIVMDLTASDIAADNIAGLVIARRAEDFCNRAIALGAE